MPAAIEACLDGETDPLHLLLARLLLSSVGEGPLSPARVQVLSHDLAHAGGQARAGILAVAVRYQVRELPPELLLSIATDSENKTRESRWAASLLGLQANAW